MANTTVADLLAASALVGDELFYADDGTQDVKVTAQQIKDFAVEVPFEIGANVKLTYTGLFVGNVVANLNINSISLVVGNTTLNATAFTTGSASANLTSNAVMLRVANSSGGANLQATQLVIGTSTVNSTAFKAGANVFMSTTSLRMGNTTVNLQANSVGVRIYGSGANVFINSSSINVCANVSVSTSTLRIGNTTANLLANAVMARMSNSTGTANLQPTQLVVGNTTNYARIGIPTSEIVGSNTFNMGANSATANGYTYLFNGFLLQWGWVAANSSEGNILFPVAFPNAIYSWQATANSAAAGAAYVISSNTTTMNVRTALTSAATNTWWMAIGR